MSEAAIRSWRQLLLLGGMVRTDELVMRFRMGAEVIQFLTGEHRNAPTLREFNHVSTLVGVGAAIPVLAPPLVALAAGEMPLLSFAARVSARRVALWAVTQPAAALALSEALLGFGLQVGEGGWESFWSQLQDPQGRWFVVAQVLMDYMHVRSSTSGAAGARSAGPVGGSEVDIEAARMRLAGVRAALRQVHDAAEVGPEALAAPRPAQVDREGRTTAVPTGVRQPGKPPPSTAKKRSTRARGSPSRRRPRRSSLRRAPTPHRSEESESSLGVFVES